MRVNKTGGIMSSEQVSDDETSVKPVEQAQQGLRKKKSKLGLIFSKRSRGNLREQTNSPTSPKSSSPISLVSPISPMSDASSKYSTHSAKAPVSNETEIPRISIDSNPSPSAYAFSSPGSSTENMRPSNKFSDEAEPSPTNGKAFADEQSARSSSEDHSSESSDDVTATAATSPYLLDANVRNSLAMLDYQLASLECVGLPPNALVVSPTSYATDDESGDEEEELDIADEHEEDEEGGATLDMANLQPSSLAMFPLPALPASADDPIWKKLGFEDPTVSRSTSDHKQERPLPDVSSEQHSPSLGAGALLIQAGYQQTVPATQAKRVVSNASLAESFSISSAISSESSGQDDFNISEFPSFSDLAAFVEKQAAEEDEIAMHGRGAAEITAAFNRSSSLLTFPIPPLEGSNLDAFATITEDEGEADDTFEAEARALMNEVRAESPHDPLMKRFSQLPVVETTQHGEEVRGLGLYDSRNESTVPHEVPAKTSFESSLSGGDDSFDADELRSDHSSSYTGSSHDVSTEASSAVGNLSTSSNEDVATIHKAVTVSPVMASIKILQGSPALSLSNSSELTSYPFPTISEEKVLTKAEPDSPSALITPVETAHSKADSISTVKPSNSLANFVDAALEPAQAIPEEEVSEQVVDADKEPRTSAVKPVTRLPLAPSASENIATPARMRRISSFSILRKRKSEANLSTITTTKSTSETTNSFGRLLRKSFSSPKLAKVASSQAVPTVAPPVPSVASVSKAVSVRDETRTQDDEACVAPVPIAKDVVAIETATPASPEKELPLSPSSANAVDDSFPVTKGLRKSSSRKRLTMYLPQVFGTRREDVPPVPKLVLPRSAPPTVTSFAQAMGQSPKSALETPGSEDTEELDDEFATAFSTPMYTPRVTTSLDLDDPILACELSMDEFREPKMDARESASASPTPSTRSEEFTLASFLDASKSNFVKAPIRSSSYFATGNQVFPIVSPKTLSSEGEAVEMVETISSPLRDSTPFADLTNSPRTELSDDKTTILDKGKGREIVVEQEVIVVPDVIAYPVRVENFLMTDDSPSAVGTPKSSYNDEEDEDSETSDHGEDDDEDEDSDDQPLGAIPGALSTQKSLRQAARKEKVKNGRAARASMILPPKAENIAEEDESSRPTSLIAPKSVTNDATSTAEIATIGHSLVPQTDDAVERRSTSSPLDPLVAESSLVIDSPPTLTAALHKSPIGARGMSMPSPSSSTAASSSRGRPALYIDTATQNAAGVPAPKLSPNLAVPKPPSSRSRSSSSPRRGTPSNSAPVMVRQTSDMSTRSAASTTSIRSNSRLTDGDRKPASSPLSRSVTSGSSSTTTTIRVGTGAGPVSEHRIFIGDAKQHLTMAVSSLTSCGEIVEAARKQGVLKFGTDNEGGFALWELCRQLGLERPIREYEVLSDVIKTWDQESNILIIRRTTLWPLLSRHLRPQPSLSRGGFVQLELKDRKWSKRYLEVRDGVVSHAKSDKGKDSAIVCRLTSFEIFFVNANIVEQRRAPKPFCFALKSKLPRAHYEDVSDYCYFVSVKTSEELSMWIKSITEARNVFERSSLVSPLEPLSARSPLLGHAPAPPLLTPRNPASHPAPPILAVSPPTISSKTFAAPSSSKPVDARTWASMDTEARTNWTKKNESALAKALSQSRR